MRVAGYRKRGGFDGTSGSLKRPVATQGRCPGIVGGGRHIGPGERGQGVEQRLRRTVSADFAAVDQQIGVRCQVISPTVQKTTARIQLVGAVGAPADDDAPVTTVSDQMHGRCSGATGERFGDLLPGISLAQLDDFGIRFAGGNLVGVAHRRVDEEKFP